MSGDEGRSGDGRAAADTARAAAAPGAAPLLQVDGLVKHFAVGGGWFGRAPAPVRAVQGVDFRLDAGQTLAVVGESGCGKSTLGRLVLRLIEPTAGRVRVDGDDLGALDAAALRQRRRAMQIIFQDPFSSLNPRMTVGQTLAEPLRLHGLHRGRERERVAELLDTVGLAPSHASRYPHEFSGGQRQRVGIARALAAEPRLIVCDEAVSALDVSVQAQVVNLLQDLQQRFGIAYLFIAHDLAVVRHIATHVAVMYLGRIVEIAATAELFASPRHPYTRALLAAIPLPQPGAVRAHVPLGGDVPSPMAPPPGCAFHPRCPAATDACARTLPVLEAVGAGAGGEAGAASVVAANDSPGAAAAAEAAVAATAVDANGSAAAAAAAGANRTHRVACLRWRELPPAPPLPAEETAGDHRLARLQAAFLAA